MNEPKSGSVFLAARGVSAADIARRAGIKLQRHGGREWACCPFHQEKTASCMFDDNGLFYCFGCHAHGDAIDFYSRLFKTDKLTAARALAGNQTIPRRTETGKKSRPSFLADPDDQGYTWDDLCAIRNAAQAAMDTGDPNSPEFWEMLAFRADADGRLDNLLAGQIEGGGGR
ncbi:MAG: hypothetical protein IKN04_22290 [Clostridia bacterium]|nr:hypothetical protein [Clostridia bacterium]MBR6185467.1 hypothetical protein [Clostridia bacterium]